VSDKMQSEVNQLAAAIVKDATELLKQTKVKIKEMRTAVERNRKLRRKLRFHPNAPHPATRAE